jgi:hypothetical protein
LIVQPGGQLRVRIPFSLYFLQQVEAGQVRSISSKSDAIEGTFARKISYPASDRHATATKLFATQVPAFSKQLSVGGAAAVQEGSDQCAQSKHRDLRRR